MTRADSRVRATLNAQHLLPAVVLSDAAAALPLSAGFLGSSRTTSTSGCADQLAVGLAKTCP